MRATLSLVLQIVLAGALIAVALEGWAERERIAALLGVAPEVPEQRSEAPAGVPVVVARVGEGTDDILFEAVGTGRARSSVALKPETSGTVVALSLRPGRPVSEGDVLLRLDDRDQRLAVELSEARLAEADRVMERYRELQSRAVTSEATLTEAMTAREIARIERDQAAAALEDRTVRAPFDGVPGIAEVEIGDRIDEDTEIARLDDRTAILIEFPMPEAWLSRLSTGMAVSARTPTEPDRLFEGTVEAIDSRLDPATRAARVRVAVPNEADRLRPGASFTVTVMLPGAPYPSVPELSLQFARTGAYVWRIADSAAERVPVRLVRRFSGTVLVEGPLSPGDRVVVEGVQRLRPGRAVEVIGSSETVVAESGAAE